MDKRYVILGAGGHARVVIDALLQSGREVYGLTDRILEPGSICLGCRVLGDDSVLESLHKDGLMFAAMGIGHVGYPAVRNRVFRFAAEKGFTLPNVVHPKAVLAASVVTGCGNYFGAGSIVNAEAAMGDLCIINTRAVVEHEVRLGDGVHVAPGATVLGQASVGDNTLIGAGSVILQGVHIGKNCLIGAGSIVLGDVEDDCTVVGNPGRIVKRRKA